MDLPSSACLQAILEGTGNPILVIFRDGIVLEANRAAVKWMDSRRDKVIGWPLWDLAPWSGAPKYRAWIDQAIQHAVNGRTFSEQLEIKRCSFAIRPGAGAGFLIAEGTDLRPLQAEVQRTRLAFEAANLGVWTWDLKKDVVTNLSDRGVFGLPPMKDYSRQQVLARIHPDDGEFLFAEADGAVASRSGFRVEVRAILPETGEVKWLAVSGAVRCDESGEPVRVDGITQDITERREVEAKLRESEARFRAIFENAGIGIALVSRGGVPVETNPVLEQLLGYTAAELKNMHFAEFTHIDSIARDSELYRDLMEGRRKRYEIEKRYIRKNGEVMWGNLVVSVLRDQDGNPQFGIAMVEDITQRKLVEEEILSLSDKLIHTQEQERSRIARELHDGIGQQIAALSISLSSLRRRIPEQEGELRAQAKRIRERIESIAEHVRRISHELHPATLELAGIAVALRSYCTRFSVDQRIEIELDAEGEFEDISPEAALCLFRVAQEALQNAAKHSGATQAAVRLERTSGQVRLTVTDHGFGFNIDSAPSHAGLGLVSMRERARLLNGRLEISSSPGVGTTLSVSIPVVAGAAA